MTTHLGKINQLQILRGNHRKQHSCVNSTVYGTLFLLFAKKSFNKSMRLQAKDLGKALLFYLWLGLWLG